MKKLSFAALALFTFSFSLFTSCAGDDWQSLMPDRELSNWRVVEGAAGEGTGPERIVVGADKVMIFAPADTAAPMPEFTNFELSAEVLVSEDAASSVWFHHGGQYGYEVVLGPKRMDDSRQTTGSLSGVRNVYKSSAPAGEWFTLDIAVRGRQITVAVNGVPTVDYVEPAEPYRAREGMQRLSKGTFVLDSYAGQTQVRGMKMRALPDDAAGRTDAIDEQNNDVIRLLQAGFPLIDHHVHLKGWNEQQAMENSRRVGIFYGLAPNCGIGFQYTTDAEVEGFLRQNAGASAFMAMQGEGREWPTTFSAATRDKFDYVFTDALTFTDHAGRRVRLWIDDEVVIDIPEEQYVDQIVDRMVEVISNEPIDIYVNPFFLPTALADRYDEWWTDARISRVVDALVANGVALEINARYKIPNARTIRAAMAAGVPLAFGTNNASPEDVGALEYCIEMLRECEITPANMYFPR